MEKDKLSTESIIKQAAMEVFLKDGFDGARMQKIADLAGVNKAMLHYYFSSKDVMFEKIFAEAMSDMVPHIEKIMNMDIPLIEKLKAFVRIHVKQQIENPKLAAFCFNEMGKNPERVLSQMEALEPMQRTLKLFFTQYENEVKAGNLVEYSPMHLFTFIQGLIDYYFISKPFFESYLCPNHADLSIDFEKNLPEQICKFLENALTKK